MSGTNGSRHGVPGSQHDDLQRAREIGFQLAQQKSLDAIREDPPDFVVAFTAMWEIFYSFQVQLFEQNAISAHTATVCGIIDKRLEDQDKAAVAKGRASQPLLDADTIGAHRAHAGDVTAIQQQVERERLEAKNDVYALTTAINRINEAIGEEPQPNAEDDKKRKGSGMRRQIALLFSIRSMALLVVAAFVGGGVLSVIVAELFKIYLLPLLVKGHL